MVVMHWERVWGRSRRLAWSIAGCGVEPASAVPSEVGCEVWGLRVSE